MSARVLTCLLLLFLAACSEPEQASLSTESEMAEREAASMPANSIPANTEAPSSADGSPPDAPARQGAEQGAEEAAGNLASAVDVSADDTMPPDPGAAYLYINAQKPNVKVLSSGLQFEILTAGEGRSPELTSTVVTHYHGSFVDGTVFDSSVDRGEPAQFPVNRVIAGWTEALQMMKEGDKWRLVIPPDLAYGEKGAGGGRIPGNSVLIFEVELIHVL